MRSSDQPRPDFPVASVSNEPERHLDSWKEIAAYLGRSEKTVRRWEQTEGLPVHRLRHDKRSSVYAYSTELEAWRKARRSSHQLEPGPDENGSAAGGHAVPPAAAGSAGGKAHQSHRLRFWLLPFIVLGLCVVAFTVRSQWNRWSVPLRAGQSSPSIQSIAVLPFRSLPPDPEDDYLADGLTEQLITELEKLGSLRVISRTSIMHFKNTTRTVSEVARELNVDALVEGTIQRSADNVRMTVQLVTPSPERHLWAHAYEGEMRNVLDLQHDLARDIGRNIRSNLSEMRPFNPASVRQADPQTNENYLRARYFLARRNADSMYKARTYFEAALVREPRYAPALSGLAVAYDLLGMYEVLPPNESFPKAKASADEALRLDGMLAEAYTARGAAASFFDLEWSAAERDFQRAIAINPSLSLAHQWYGEHLIAVGKAQRAVAELERARDLDPLSLVINATLGRVYRDARRYNEAIQQCRKTLELDPHFAMGHWCLGQVYIGQHRYTDAISELQLANGLGTTPLILRDLAWAYAAAGNKSKAIRILNGLRQTAQSAYNSPYSFAAISAALGDKDAAFGWLEKAYEERDCHIGYLALDPEVDPLRRDPRFTSLLARLRVFSSGS
jgi:TolB-like protein/Flp pilus assembly protein TadD